MATTEPQSRPLSESEKLAATLAALEDERRRRVEAGKLGTRPILQVLPAEGETLEAAQQREVYRHLADHPNAPKDIGAYEWIQFVIVDPKPVVELPDVQYAPDHAHAVDVTPPPYRPPMPPSSSGRSVAPPTADPRRYNVPQSTAARMRAREIAFQNDEWGSSDAWPIRYPKGYGR